MLRKDGHSLAKFVNRYPRFEIEAGQHMKHMVPLIGTVRVDDKWITVDP